MARFVLTFRKGEEVRWLGHLDMMRAFERIIRRAQVPVAYSQGFNPRPKMSIASALGLGVTGDAEKMSLETVENIEPAQLADIINAQSPRGIEITDADRIPEGVSKSIKVSGSEFRVSVKHDADFSKEELENAVKQLLYREEVTVSRTKDKRTKSVNIRPGIESITVEDNSHLLMRLVHSEGFTPKPAEIIDILAESLPGLQLEAVHRVKLY